jgi:hypothetical protein
MTQEALKLALEALEYWDVHGKLHQPTEEAITAIKEALTKEKTLQALHDENERLGLYKDAYAQPEQEPVAHSVIAGVLFDFMGWLTSRKERIVLSSADNASPAVEAITEFAKMRGLSLDDAKVQDWHIHLSQRTFVGLTDEEMMWIYGQDRR